MTERRLVDKWFALGAACKDRELSQIDTAVFWEILEHANYKDLVAFPGTRRLARLTGIHHRNVDRHVEKLVRTGYIELVGRGNIRGDTNRYLPTFKGADELRHPKQRAPLEMNAAEGPAITTDDTTPVVTGDGTTPVITADGRVPSAVSKPVVSCETNLPSPVTTKPPNEPAYKAGELVVGVEGRGPHRIGASGASLAAAAETEEGFTRFMAVYPRKSNVARARGPFRAVVAGGVAVELLVAQAAAYAARCDAERTLPKHVQEPANWLQHQRWLDDFTVASPRRRRQDSPRGRNPALDTETDPAELCRLRFEELQRALRLVPGSKDSEKLQKVIIEAYCREHEKQSGDLWQYDTAGEVVEDIGAVLSVARRGAWPASVNSPDEGAPLFWLWFGHEGGRFANALIAQALEMATAHEQTRAAA